MLPRSSPRRAQAVNLIYEDGARRHPTRHLEQASHQPLRFTPACMQRIREEALCTCDAVLAIDLRSPHAKHRLSSLTMRSCWAPSGAPLQPGSPCAQTRPCMHQWTFSDDNRHIVLGAGRPALCPEDRLSVFLLAVVPSLMLSQTGTSSCAQTHPCMLAQALPENEKACVLLVTVDIGEGTPRTSIGYRS